MAQIHGNEPIRLHESAGEYIELSVPTASPVEKASETIQRLLEFTGEWDSLTYVYVLDESDRPVGIVPLERLFAAGPDNIMSGIMRRDIRTVDPQADQEQVVIEAISGDLDAIPAVDSQGRFIGAIDHDSILAILHHENVEDYLRSSGFRVVHPIVDMAKARAWELVRLRVPWLILGLVGGMLITAVISYFEQAIEKQIALAFFIPVIVYMSDAVGTQTETIFIRSLSRDTFSIQRYILREGLIGLALASVLSILIFLFTLAYIQSTRVAGIVGLAMFMSIFAAVFIAILIPWIFSRFQKDPAFASGPFATIIQDLLSITIYFVIATLVLFRQV